MVGNIKKIILNFFKTVAKMFIMAVLSDKSAQASQALGAWILRGNKRVPLCKSSVAV